MLTLTEVFRLNQEVALVSVYLPLQVPTDRECPAIVNYRCIILRGIL